MKPTQLSQLYPAATRMAEVSPCFEGMDLFLWNRLKFTEQCDAYRETRKGAPLPKWAEGKIYNARDNYGMKGPGV